MTRTLIATDRFGRIAQLTIAVLAVLAVVAGPAAAATPTDAGADGADAAVDAPVTADFCGYMCVGSLDRPGVYSPEDSGGWRVAVKKFEETAY